MSLICWVIIQIFKDKRFIWFDNFVYRIESWHPKESKKKKNKNRKNANHFETIKPSSKNYEGYILNPSTIVIKWYF